MGGSKRLLGWFGHSFREESYKFKCRGGCQYDLGTAHKSLNSFSWGFLYPATIGICLEFVVNTANVEIWAELIDCVWSFGVNPQLQFAIKDIFNKFMFCSVQLLKLKWKFSMWKYVKELKTKEYAHVVVFYLFYCGKARPGPVTIWSEYGWMGASAAILFSRKDFRKIIKKYF